MLDFSVLFVGDTKHLLGLILRCGCEGKVAGRGHELASLHHGIDLVFIVCVVIRGKAGKSQIHIGGVTPALAGMRLVDDDGELVIFMFLSNLGNDVRELLYSGYNNALAVLNSFTQVSGMFCPDNRIPHLHKLLDGVADLLIQNTAVSDYQNRVNHRMTVFFKTD